MKYRELFAPIQIGKLEIPNRYAMAPMGPLGLGDCEVSDAQQIFSTVCHLCCNPTYCNDSSKDHSNDSALLAGFLPVDTKKDDDEHSATQ